MPKIRKIQLEKEIPVYDITVENTHNFYANNIVVHNCAEIELPTNAERTAVCCLSSINLEKWDEWKDTTLVKDLIKMLDNVLEYFVKTAPDEISKARYSAFRERSLGLGTMGFHHLLQKNLIAFESQDARNINKEIFSHINEESIKATKELGIEKGECPDFIVDLKITLDNGFTADIPSSDFVDVITDSGLIEKKRAFQLKLTDKIYTNGNTGIVEIIEGKHPTTGWRNANLTAIAPTANSGILCGTSPSIEPSNSNAYTQQTRAGTFEVKNPHLEAVLELKGLNTDETWSRIINAEGSIQHMGDIFTDHELKVFKTAFELNQNWIIRHAADRQPFITQGQSINLFFDHSYNKEDFSSIHIRAWKSGLKTLYYTRTKSSARADNVGEKIVRTALEDAKPDDDYDDGSCLACEG